MLAGRQVLLVVIDRAVVLHLVARKEAAHALQSRFAPEEAAHAVGARLQLCGRYRLVEAEIIGHGAVARRREGAVVLPVHPLALAEETGIGGAVGVGAGQVPSVGNALHGGSGSRLSGRLVLEVAVHEELAGQGIGVLLRQVPQAAHGEVVHLEPTRLVGLPPGIADAAGLDADGQVLALADLQHDAHGVHHGVALVSGFIACEGAHLVGPEDVVIVALVGVVLHMVVGKEAARTALAGLVPEPAAHFIDARLELCGRYRLVEAEVLGHGFGLEPADGAAVLPVDGAVAVRDAVGVAAHRAFQRPAVGHTTLYAAGGIGADGRACLVELEIGIHEELVGEVKVLGIRAAVDNLAYHEGRVHGIEAEADIPCRRGLVREAGLGIAVHDVVAPDVRLGAALDAPRCDGARADAHADAEVVGCRHGEGGQTAHDNLVRSLLQGQGIFDVRPLAACRGRGIGRVVDGPDGDATAADAQVLLRLPRAATGGIAVAGDIHVAFFGQFSPGIVHLVGCGGVGHAELNARSAGVGRTVHHAVPLASGGLRVVDVREVDDIAVARACQGRVLHAAGAVADAGIPEAELGAQGLDVLPGRRKDGIGHQLEVGILQALRDAARQGLHTGGKCLIVADALLHLLGRKGDFIDGLGLALCRQAVVLEADVAYLVGKVLAEGLRRPPPAELPRFVRRPSVHVPCQLHAELKLYLRRLDVAYVHHPEARHAVLVGLRQLVAYQRGRDGAEPDIGARVAEVREMVVDAVASAAPPLGCRGQLAYEGIVIVHPAHGHVVGNPESRIVECEGFLIGDVYLRHLRRVAAQRVGDDFALCRDDVRQALQLCRLPVVAEKGNVLQAAHANVVDAFVAAGFACTLGPVVVTALGVGGKSEVAAVVTALEARPLPQVVA